MRATVYTVTGHLTVDGKKLKRALRAWARAGRHLLIGALVVSILFPVPAFREAWANPVNPAVVAGEATVSGLGTDRVTIQQASSHAIIHWGQFNIAPNEVTSFLQPVGGIALNRIFDAHASMIDGMLNATGTVILLNPNGVLFGRNAQVNVGGLVASTLHMTDADFLAGLYRFGGASTHFGFAETSLGGMVRNEGQITAGPFGAYLFAHNVENAGIIKSPEGHIALAAGASAYLSNRPDGRGLFVEVQSPTGHATNLKDLIADAGQVSLFGKVVNQSGLIQANSIREVNGRVELIASEAVTLADGSRIVAKGDAAGLSRGGTVIAKADLATGRTEFQNGALIDVSGGAEGGHGGFIELSARQVTWEGAFRAHALAGYRGGKLLIDPVFSEHNPITTSVLSSFSGTGLNDIEFQSAAGTDLTVTARFDLSEWLLPDGQVGTLTFNAGRNLLFNNASITNGERGQGAAGSRWDYKLLANEHIEIRGSVISTGSGGSITVEAGRSPSAFGDVTLTQLNTTLSGQPMLETFAGGDISITTDRDLIAPSGLISSVVTGIRLNELGNLTLNVGRNFLGGLAGSSLAGPGFLLGNGTANVNVGTNVGIGAGQHLAGGHVGWDGNPITPTNQPLYANLTVGGGKIDGEGKLIDSNKAAVNVTASGNISLGLVQDRGLVEDVFGTGDLYVTAHPESSVSLLTTKGDIFLNPQLANSAGGINLARKFYPASFDAQAPQGKIAIESDLNFWPSVTGKLNFFAKQDLAGVVRQVGTRKDPRYQLVFVGDNEATGSWQLLFIPTASQDPSLGRFIARSESQLSQATLNKKPRESEFTETQWPSIPQFSNAQVVILRQGDLKNLQGIFSNQVNSTQPLPQGVDPAHPAQDVAFKSETGSIYSLVLNLLSPVFKKKVTVEAAKDIGTIVDPVSGSRTGGEFTLITSVPEGVTASVSAGGNMGFSRNCPTCTETGLEFFGKGAAKIRVGSLDAQGNPVPGTGHLDLGDGRGIQHRISNGSEVVDAPGLIDIEVGHNISMTQTRVVSHNGADIWIHGLGTKPALNPDGSPTDQLVQGAIDPVSKVLMVDGKQVKVEGVPLMLDGSQPVVSQATVLDRPGELIDGKSFIPLFVKGKPVIVDGKIVLLVEGQVQLVDATKVSIEQATGGKLTVGTFGSNPNSGILTIRGGNIDIKTKGDVDVFKSRIATLTGGNISVYSVEGDINAGSGGRNESIPFRVQLFDENGNPLRDENGAPRFQEFLVPGSGIFTHHGSDPKFPLNFPKFDTPEITALKGEIVKQNFLGRNTQSLESQVARLVEAREPVFRQVFEQFIRQNPDKGGLPLELGDITLRAGRDLVVPSAGIRGRRIRIFAGRNLDLQGGTIEGEVQFDVEGSVKGSLSSFVGAFSGTAAIGGSVSGGASAGGSSLGGGLAGVTGTVSATASATSSTSATASKTVESVQEKSTESSTQQARAQAEKQVVASNDGKDGKSKGLQAVKMKRGVVIQVDVKPQAPPQTQPGS